MGQLQHFDIVERLLQNQQAVRATEPFGHLIPGIIGIGGADNDLEVRVGGPKPGDGFNAIPARGHANIHKRQGIRPAILQRACYQGQSLLALIGGIEDEVDLFTRCRGGAEQGGLSFVQGGHLDFVEDLPKVLVNCRGIIDRMRAESGSFVGAQSETTRV